ncbi:hypothetical protein DDZ13_08940 [Coraliomargarita sinensis]|uniref:Uncharacterized protein n=1 Tax=Coraliomargarita sinensis TaxID=2174842 RepID=A0A317ZF61_9BACT|nr:hypothetical protein DDZ13_08940 [Coraliomargarita sinensis]
MKFVTMISSINTMLRQARKYIPVLFSPRQSSEIFPVKNESQSGIKCHLKQLRKNDQLPNIALPISRKMGMFRIIRMIGIH